MRLLGGMVMRHCPIRIESCDGIETQRNKIGAASSRSRQALIDGQLGNTLTPPSGIQPGKELTQRSTVLLHRLTDIKNVIKALL